TKAAAGTARHLRPPRPGARRRPQLALPYQDASWWVLAKLDSALVSAADGTSAAWYQRDRTLFRSLGWRSAILHARLRRQWPRLAADYRAAAVAAAMLVLGWWGIARGNSMGNDEVATRWAALLPLRELAHLLSNVDAVHGLYYLLMHGWAAVGSSPVALRIPSVIAMTAAAVLTVIIGRRLTGSAWAGLFAGLITVLTPRTPFSAQTARSYAMVVACV